MYLKNNSDVTYSLNQLREQEEILIKRQHYLERKMEEEQDIALKNVKTHRRASLRAQKRKKSYVRQLQQNDGTLTNIEQYAAALELLKKGHADMASMRDDIEEQHDVVQEISEAISSPRQEFYDDELEAELKKLEAEGDLTEHEVALGRMLLKYGPVEAEGLTDVPAAETNLGCSGS